MAILSIDDNDNLINTIQSANNTLSSGNTLNISVAVVNRSSDAPDVSGFDNVTVLDHSSSFVGKNVSRNDLLNQYSGEDYIMFVHANSTFEAGWDQQLISLVPTADMIYSQYNNTTSNAIGFENPSEIFEQVKELIDMYAESGKINPGMFGGRLFSIRKIKSSSSPNVAISYNLVFAHGSSHSTLINDSGLYGALDESYMTVKLFLSGFSITSMSQLLVDHRPENDPGSYVQSLIKYRTTSSKVENPETMLSVSKFMLLNPADHELHVESDKDLRGMIVLSQDIKKYEEYLAMFVTALNAQGQ